jgi:hypothetical protein
MGVEPNFQDLPRGKSQDRIQWRIDVLPKVKEVLKGFEGSGVFHPTIRAVYYKLFSIGAIPENSMRMYKGLVRMLTDVRMEGTDRDVNPATFSDESRESPDDEEIQTAQGWAEAEADYLKRLLNGENNFQPHPWQNQPYYVEVWIEKQAMYSTFESVLQGKMVAIQSSRGFNSLSTLFEAYIRLRKVQKAYPDRRIVILYFGDLDPSGDAMDEDIRSRLDRFMRRWGYLQYEFVRIGVKPEHVTEYNLPPDPDEATAERLEANDSRTRRFKAKYGRLYAIELDALAGQEPEAFKRLVLDAVEQYYDSGIWDKVQKSEAAAKARRELKKQIQNEIVPLLEKGKKENNKK